MPFPLSQMPHHSPLLVCATGADQVVSPPRCWLLDSAYYCRIRIESDPKKAASNLKKHGASFNEAASCLLDPLARVRDDPDAADELRLVLLGMSRAGRLLTVCYTLRDDAVIRLISARKATKREGTSYA